MAPPALQGAVHRSAGATPEKSSRGGFFDIAVQAENALLIHRVRADRKSGLLVNSTVAVTTALYVHPSSVRTLRNVRALAFGI